LIWFIFLREKGIHKNANNSYEIAISLGSDFKEVKKDK
jgi:hypothetical protein